MIVIIISELIVKLIVLKDKMQSVSKHDRELINTTCNVLLNNFDRTDKVEDLIRGDNDE